VDVDALGVDLLTLSAHKIHGPKGAGALYVRRGARLAPLCHGGEHERGLRAGTENVAAIVGLGAAAGLAAAERESRVALWRRLRRVFLDSVLASVPDVRVNSPDDAVANTISLTIRDVEGEAALLGLDLEGFAVATGAACSSGAAEPSHVLRAIGLTAQEAEQSIRVSMHADSTEDEVRACGNALARVVKGLRALRV
jgi:cysteine desulfurase